MQGGEGAWWLQGMAGEPRGAFRMHPPQPRASGCVRQDRRDLRDPRGRGWGTPRPRRAWCLPSLASRLGAPIKAAARGSCCHPAHSLFSSPSPPAHVAHPSIFLPFPSLRCLPPPSAPSPSLFPSPWPALPSAPWLPPSLSAPCWWLLLSPPLSLLPTHRRARPKQMWAPLSGGAAARP